MSKHEMTSVVTPGQLLRLGAEVANALSVDHRLRVLPSKEVQVKILEVGGSERWRIGEQWFELVCQQAGINPYAQQIRRTKKDYPKRYHQKELRDQLDIQLNQWSPLGLNNAKDVLTATRRYWGDDMVLPKHAEHFQVLPKLSSVAARSGFPDPYGEGYLNCLSCLVARLTQIGVNSERYSVTLLGEEVKRALEHIEPIFPGDFIVVPVQMGRRLAGHSRNAARWIFSQNNQWPLSLWEVGNTLLVHPELKDFGIDCSGNEPGRLEMMGSTGGMLHLPAFPHDRRVPHDDMSNHWDDYDDPGFGAASGFYKKSVRQGPRG